MKTPPRLLDGNVLVALADASHVHHAFAARWFAAERAPFATCPITQGTLVRMLLRFQAINNITVAAEILASFVAHPRHRYWSADLSYTSIRWKGVVGHRQVTDAYLIALARHHEGAVATFDRGLVALYPETALQIPIDET